MKSISLDSPDLPGAEEQRASTARSSATNNYHHGSMSGGLSGSRNLYVPKVVEPQSNSNGNGSAVSPGFYQGIGIGGRRYGGWANVVRNRAALQSAAAAASTIPSMPGLPGLPGQGQEDPGVSLTTEARRRQPPCSMDMTATSAPPSYNQCKQTPRDVLLSFVWLSGFNVYFTIHSDT